MICLCILQDQAPSRFQPRDDLFEKGIRRLHMREYADTENQVVAVRPQGRGKYILIEQFNMVGQFIRNSRSHQRKHGLGKIKQREITLGSEQRQRE